MSTMIEVDTVCEPNSPEARQVAGTGRVIGTPQRVTFAAGRDVMDAMRRALAGPDPVVVIVTDSQIVGGHN
jgi:hypothetical protein